MALIQFGLGTCRAEKLDSRLEIGKAWFFSLLIIIFFLILILGGGD